MRSLALVLLFSAIIGTSQQIAQQTSQEAQAEPTTPKSAVQSSRPQAAEIQALREDLQHMKELERQMETNLAFVDTTQSPLKHQFQLEIDMWRTMIASMERRLAAMSH